MGRFKIRSKKPKDSIKEKTPQKEIISTITEKKPIDPKKDFKLPPSRVSEEKELPKKSVLQPTRYGLKEKDSKRGCFTTDNLL